MHEFFFKFRSPAEKQGDKKLVQKLIQLFSSTEIFSKRRKIYTSWRKTWVNDFCVEQEYVEHDMGSHVVQIPSFRSLVRMLGWSLMSLYVNVSRGEGRGGGEGTPTWSDT